MSFRIILVALAIASLAVTIARGQYEDQVLASRGAWQLVLTKDTRDYQSWCSAETTNAEGQIFSLVGYDTGTFAISVFDNDWNLEQREIAFRIDVDDNRWNITGEARRKGIYVSPSDAGDAADFIEGVRRGNAVAVYDSGGELLARFSLKGSSFTIGKLVDCWQSVRR